MTHKCILMVGNSWPRMSAIGSEEALTWIKGTFTQVPTTFPGWNLNNSKVIFHPGSPNLCQDSPLHNTVGHDFRKPPMGRGPPIHPHTHIYPLHTVHECLEQEFHVITNDLAAGPNSDPTRAECPSIVQQCPVFISCPDKVCGQLNR